MYLRPAPSSTTVADVYVDNLGTIAESGERAKECMEKICGVAKHTRIEVQQLSTRLLVER